MIFNIVILNFVILNFVTSTVNLFHNFVEPKEMLRHRKADNLIIMIKIIFNPTKSNLDKDCHNRN